MLRLMFDVPLRLAKPHLGLWSTVVLWMQGGVVQWILGLRVAALTEMEDWGLFYPSFQWQFPSRSNRSRLSPDFGGVVKNLVREFLA